MVECKCCGKSISPKAQTCPHCGEPSPVPPGPPPPVTLGHVLEAFGVDRSMRLWLGLAFIGAGAATWVYYGMRDAQQRPAQPPASVEMDRKESVAAGPAAGLSASSTDPRQSANEPPARR